MGTRSAIQCDARIGSEKAIKYVGTVKHLRMFLSYFREKR